MPIGTDQIDILFGTEQYRDREKVLNESTYLSPNSISAFSLVTHIPLVHEGIEDTLFFACRDRLERWLATDDQASTSKYDRESGTPAPPPRSILGRHGRLVLEHQVDEFFPQDLPAGQNGGRPQPEPAMARRARDIARSIDQQVLALVGEKPEYWLFSCHSLIIQQVNRRAIREWGRIIEAWLTSGDPPLGQGEVAVIMRCCEKCIEAFACLLTRNAHTVKESVDRLVAKMRDELGRLPRPSLGGMISAFESIEAAHSVTHDTPTRARLRNGIETFENDFIELDLSGNEHIHRSTSAGRVDSHYKLRWYRSNQFWNYTFIESWKCKSPSHPEIPWDRHDSTAQPNLYEIPYVNLAQQGDDIRQAYAKGIGQFLGLILGFMTHPSVTQSQFIEQQILTHQSVI